MISGNGETQKGLCPQRVPYSPHGPHFFFFSSRRRHTRWTGDWSSDVCSSDLEAGPVPTAGGTGALDQLSLELQPDALKAAQQRDAKDFACPAMTAEVTRRETIVEGQTTGWRSEERRVGKECRSRGAPCHEKKR